MCIYAHAHIDVSCVHSNSSRALLVLDLGECCACFSFVVKVFMEVVYSASQSAQTAGENVSMWRLRRLRRRAARLSARSVVVLPPPGLPPPGLPPKRGQASCHMPEQVIETGYLCSALDVNDVPEPGVLDALRPAVLAIDRKVDRILAGQRVLVAQAPARHKPDGDEQVAAAQRLARLEEVIDSRFAKLEGRLIGIDHGLQDVADYSFVDDLLSQAERRHTSLLVGLVSCMQMVQKYVAEARGEISAISGKLDELGSARDDRIASLEAMRRGLTQRLSALREQFVLELDAAIGEEDNISDLHLYSGPGTPSSFGVSAGIAASCIYAEVSEITTAVSPGPGVVPRFADSHLASTHP